MFHSNFFFFSALAFFVHHAPCSDIYLYYYLSSFFAVDSCGNFLLIKHEAWMLTKWEWRSSTKVGNIANSNSSFNIHAIFSLDCINVNTENGALRSLRVNTIPLNRICDDYSLMLYQFFISVTPIEIEFRRNLFVGMRNSMRHVCHMLANDRNENNWFLSFFEL